MKDRFKFRCWNTIVNGFVPIIMNGDGDFSIDQNSFEWEYGDDWDYVWEKENNTLEQCTGLKDKNGKLIYEGDILKPNNNTITKEVVYEDGSYWAKDTIYFHDKCHIFQRWIDECGYEIVGNIHEKVVDD